MSSRSRKTGIPDSAAPRPRLVEVAYAHIREQILNGSLPPGTPLSRRALARSLGLSPLPVGVALNRLVSEGFLEARPRAGTLVRIPTAGDIRGNYILREALETQAARLFAASASAAERRRLLDLARRLDDRYAKLRPGASPAAAAAVEKRHVDFHLFIARSTRCPQLVEAIERSRVLLFNWLFSRSGSFVPLPPTWHSDLAEVLAAAGPAEAAEAMRAHVRFRLDEVMTHFRRLRRRFAAKAMVRGPRNAKCAEAAEHAPSAAAAAPAAREEVRRAR